MDGTIILLSAGETSLDIAELPRPICGEATRDRETELERARPPNFSTPAVDQVIVTFTVTYKHKYQHGNCSRPRFRNRRYCLLRSCWLGGFQALPRWHQRCRQGLLQGRLRAKDDQKGSCSYSRNHRTRSHSRHHPQEAPLTHAVEPPRSRR
ncbi:hypothetical protein D6D27_01658 [Aureobasidium pullulans]|nr:hypothetical protein D6D27_01658 [Aureobasidium pullulans]